MGNISKQRRLWSKTDLSTGLLAKDAPRTWVDHDGRTWKTSTILRRLKFTKCPGHEALRRFVFARDGGKCQWCKATSDLVPDHIISRRNGGAHHPDNLRTLCSGCNAAKTGLVDARRANVSSSESVQ